MAKKIKTQIIQPKVPKRKKGGGEMPQTKRSVILHKKQERLENLFLVLGEVERTIQELSRLYIEVPESKHRGVGGRLKPTDKQRLIAVQLEHAQKRADKLIKLINSLM